VETRTTAVEWLKQIHPEDYPAVVTAAIRTMKGEIITYSVECRVQLNGDEWGWIHSRGQVVERDAGGRALRMIGTNTDITEYKRAEEILQEHAHNMERFNKLAIGRELQMINLKKEINALLAELNRAKKYVIHDPEMTDV